MKAILTLIVISLSVLSNIAMAQVKVYEIEMKIDEFKVDRNVGMTSTNNPVLPLKSYTCQLNVTVSNEAKEFSYNHTPDGVSDLRISGRYVVREKVGFELDCPTERRSSLRDLDYYEAGFFKGTSFITTVNIRTGEVFKSQQFGCVGQLFGYSGGVIECPDVPYQVPSRLSFVRNALDKKALPVYLILENGKITVGGTPNLISGTYKIL